MSESKILIIYHKGYEEKDSEYGDITNLYLFSPSDDPNKEIIRMVKNGFCTKLKLQEFFTWGSKFIVDGKDTRGFLDLGNLQVYYFSPYIISLHLFQSRL